MMSTSLQEIQGDIETKKKGMVSCRVWRKFLSQDIQKEYGEIITKILYKVDKI